MKKTAALLLTLMLMLGCASAFAEAAAAETAWITLEFDDFTIDVPEDIVWQSGDREENATFLILYPNYDETASFAANINFIWSSAVQDFSDIDPKAYGQYVMEAVCAQFNQIGITTANETLMSAAADEVCGKPAISMMYSAQCDFAALGGGQCTLYTIQSQISDEAFGLYTITVSLADDSINDMNLLTLIEEIINSIQWTK